MPQMLSCSSQSARLLLAAVILATCLGCDQATKRIATQKLRDSPPRSYLSGAVRLEFALNPGGFLSLGSRLPPRLRFWAFTAISGTLLVAIACLLAMKWHMRLASFVPLVFVFAGATGNLIDRLTQDGLVTDFIILGIGPLRTGIFNVADVAITIGGVAFVLFYRDERAAPTS